MFSPGGFLSGVLAPWVIFAPAVPLFVILFKRIFFDQAIFSLVMLCVVTLLVNLFVFLIHDQPALQHLFQNIAMLLEFIFASLLLRNCTNDTYLKYTILAGMLAFVAVFFALGAYSGFQKHYSYLGKACFVLLFVLSLLTIISQFKSIDRHLTESHLFWIAAGLFFQYGLVSLLLFMNQDVEPDSIAADGEFGILYTIITVIKFLFFSAGLLIYKKLDIK